VFAAFVTVVGIDSEVWLTMELKQHAGTARACINLPSTLSWVQNLLHRFGASTCTMPPPVAGWRERLSDMYDRVKGGKFENNGWPVCVLEAYTILTPARPTPV
jgi:hypothetical protein